MRYNILLFDLDGTVLDFDRSEKEALTKLFRSKSIFDADKYLKVYFEINKKLWEQYEKSLITMDELLNTRFSKTMGLFGISIDGAKWENEYRKYLGQYGYIIKDADTVLNRLSDNHRLFAVTNGIGDTQISRLKIAGIYNCFEDVFVSQLIGAQKPSRAFFDYVFSRIKDFDKSSTLIIGDSLSSDVIGGINSGIDICYFNSNKTAYDKGYKINYEISSLIELLEI